MDEQAYLTDRVDDQIDWMSAKAGRNQKWFRRLRLIELAAAASIPFGAGLIREPGDAFALSVGLLGVAVAVIAGVMSLFQFQETWVEYRQTAERLKREKYVFLTRTEPYDGEDRLHVFVQRVEAALSDERSSWSERTAATGAEPVSGEEEGEGP
jgi:hypothetical protein